MPRLISNQRNNPHALAHPLSRPAILLSHRLHLLSTASSLATHLQQPLLANPREASGWGRVSKHIGPCPDIVVPCTHLLSTTELRICG